LGHFSIKMIRFFILAIGVFSVAQSQSGSKTCATNQVCVPNPSGAVDCLGDCSCRDTMADECGRPHPTTAVHTETISDCMANCQVFALEGRCKFIIWHFDNIDENCIIMNDEFEAYIGHCNQRGQALWGPNPGQGLARWEGCRDNNHCNNDGLPNKNSCNTCTDCTQEGCRGYILSDCNIYSDFVESSPQTTLGHCEIWARTTLQGTYAVFNREQGVCEVYGDVVDHDNRGFERECKVAIVELGTDPIDCGSKPDPTDPPTPPPPECVTDPDCPEGQICTEHQKCEDGCRTSDDCGDHPCSCSGECTEDVDPCHWCDTSVSLDGKCVPGCADSLDCLGELGCNGQHMCSEPGVMSLDTMTMTTSTCEGCAGTNVEVGAQILIMGDNQEPIFKCVIENLDHADRVDYQDGAAQTFYSTPDHELGGCTLANLNGYDITMFTVTWHGEGVWTPSMFTLTFTGTTKVVNCPYSGNPLETGKSETLTCTKAHTP